MSGSNVLSISHPTSELVICMHQFSPVLHNFIILKTSAVGVAEFLLNVQYFDFTKVAYEKS